MNKKNIKKKILDILLYIMVALLYSCLCLVFYIHGRLVFQIFYNVAIVIWVALLITSLILLSKIVKIKKHKKGRLK